jgi:SPOR domain
MKCTTGSGKPPPNGPSASWWPRLSSLCRRGCVERTLPAMPNPGLTEGPVNRKILGSLGLVAGLLLAAFVTYQFLAKPEPPSPPQPFQGVIQPEPPPQPAPVPAAPPEPTPPPAPEPALPPVTAPVAPPEPPPAGKESVLTPPAGAQAEPALLAGKFRRYADARRLLAKIQKQKMPAFIRKKGKYYQVWAGPFPTSQEAAQARKNLRAKLKISSRQEKVEIPVPK